MSIINNNDENDIKKLIKDMLQLKSQQKHFERVSEFTLSALKSVLSNDFYNYRHELMKKKQYDRQLMIKNLKTLVMARKRLKKDITDKNKLKEFGKKNFMLCFVSA